VTVGFVAVGFTVGGVAGDRRFDAVHDPQEFCASCHDAEEVLTRATMPHSPDYTSICHACHVYGTEEYVTALFGTIGLGAPGWAADLPEPALADQTCLGCHHRIARPEIDCSVCHTDEQTEVLQVASCETCHVDQVPIHPHDAAPCAQCHLETVASPRGMANMLLRDSVQRREAGRERIRPGSTMRTKDMDVFGAEDAP